MKWLMFCKDFQCASWSISSVKVICQTWSISKIVHSSRYYKQKGLAHVYYWGSYKKPCSKSPWSQNWQV